MTEEQIVNELKELPNVLRDIIIEYKPILVEDVDYLVPPQLLLVHNELFSLFWEVESHLRPPGSALMELIQDRVWLEFQVEYAKNGTQCILDFGFYLKNHGDLEDYKEDWDDFVNVEDENLL